MPIPGRPDYRIHLGYPVHLGAYEVVGQMARDGVVELISFGADAVGLIDPSDHPPESF